MIAGTLKILTAAAIIATLTGCSDSQDNSISKSKNYTISELVENETLLNELVVECKNNPGELGETPNCINASAAERKLKYERLSKKYSQ